MYFIDVKTNTSISTIFANYHHVDIKDPELLSCIDSYAEEVGTGKCDKGTKRLLSADLDKLHVKYKETLKIVPLQWYHALVKRESTSSCQKRYLPDYLDFTDLVKGTLGALGRAQDSIGRYEAIKQSKTPKRRFGVFSVRSHVAANAYACKLLETTQHAKSILDEFHTVVEMQDLSVSPVFLWRFYESLTIINYLALTGEVQD